MDKIERRKEKAEDELKDKKKENGKVGRELAKVEQDIREAVSARLIRYCSSLFNSFSSIF